MKKVAYLLTGALVVIATSALAQQGITTVLGNQPIKPFASTAQEKATRLINSLIEHTESFITKCSSIPELPDKIKPWIKEDKINLTSTTTWQTFKAELELFVQKLRKVLDRDAKTKEQKYLTDLIDHASTYKNLVAFEKSLIKQEPKIEATVFGLQKMSTEGKNALFATINLYANAFNRLALVEGLDAVFEKYEPTAQKIALEQKSAQENAEIEAKKKPQPERGIVTGGSRNAGSGFGGGYDTNDYNYNRFGGGYSPTPFTDYGSSGNNPSNNPSAGNSFGSNESKNDTPASSGGGGGSSRGGKKSDDDEKSKKPEAAPIDPKKNTDEKILSDPSQKRAQPETTHDIQSIADELKAVGKTIANTPHLKAIKTHITDTKQPVDPDLVKLISTIGTKLSRATKAIDLLAANTEITHDTKLRYKARLQSVFKDAKLPQLSTHIDELEAGIADKSITITKEKQTAYLTAQSNDAALLAKLKIYMAPEEYKQIESGFSEISPDQKKELKQVISLLSDSQLKAAFKNGLQGFPTWIEKNQKEIAQQALTNPNTADAIDSDTYSLYQLNDSIKELQKSIEGIAPVKKSKKESQKEE